MMGVMQLCYQKKMYHEFVSLWEAIREKLWLYGRWNEVEELKEQLEKAYMVLERPLDLADYYSEHLSRILFYLGRVEEAEKHLYLAKELVENDKDTLRKGNINQKFGIHSLFKNEYKKAKKYFHDAIKYIKMSSFREDHIHAILKTHVYLGITYSSLNEFKLAHHHLITALDNPEDRDVNSFAILALGDNSLRMNDIESAEVHFLNAIKIETDLKRKLGQAKGYLGMAKVKKLMKCTPESKVFLKKSIQCFSELNMQREVVNAKKEYLILKNA